MERGVEETFEAWRICYAASAPWPHFACLRFPSGATQLASRDVDGSELSPLPEELDSDGRNANSEEKDAEARRILHAINHAFTASKLKASTGSDSAVAGGEKVAHLNGPAGESSSSGHTAVGGDELNPAAVHALAKKVHDLRVRAHWTSPRVPQADSVPLYTAM